MRPIKLVVTGRESAALTAFLADRRSEMVSRQLALTEVIRIVRRSCYDSQRRLSVDPAVRDKRLATAASLLDRIDLVVVNRSLLLAAAAFDDDPHVGSLDAVHLASARELDDALESFVTYDKTLARAAAAAGLPLGQPS